MVTNTTWEERIVKRMYAGSREDILRGLKSPSPYFLTFAILAGMAWHERSPEFIDGLLAAKDDRGTIFHFRGGAGYAGELAKAALDVCGIEKYQGDDPIALQYLESKFEDPSAKRMDTIYQPPCERFEEWKDVIRAYCEENGLSYEKTCQLAKSCSKDMLVLMCDDYTKLISPYVAKNIPFPAVLYITRTENGLQFKQTEYTQQILAP